MTPRKGESRADFKARRADYDAGRGADHRTPEADPAYVQALEKEIATLKAAERRRLEEEREDALRSSLKFNAVKIPATKHAEGAPGYPMTIWSDLHVGETVDRRETGNLNAFDQAIAVERMANLANRTIMLLRDYSGKKPLLPGMWVNLGGDMVSGLIHEELVETNWGNIVEQCMLCAGLVEGALLRVADFVCTKPGAVIDVACVPGNHGRVTKKPTAKGRTDSYDMAIYKSLAKKLANDKRFKFHITTDTDYLFEVYGHRFLLTHGDSLGVKGGDGIIGALGPIARGAVKLRNSEGQIGRDFDTLIMGHWHQYIPRGDALGVIVNGTLKGYDEFARTILRARFAKPSQALWLVAPKHGIAAQWAVYLD